MSQSFPCPDEEEVMDCYKVLEMVRDHHDEAGLVQKVNILNEAHSIVQEFEQNEIE